jgi:hypothetical protein
VAECRKLRSGGGNTRDEPVCWPKAEKQKARGRRKMEMISPSSLLNFIPSPVMKRLIKTEIQTIT